MAGFSAHGAAEFRIRAVFSRLHAASRPAIALGAALGAAMFGALSTLCRGLFHLPAGGVGFVTVHAYPKGFDYFVVGMLFAGAVVGGLLGGIFSPHSEKAGGGACLPTGMTKTTWVGALVIFLLMLVLHDHPYALMEPFHEGEHLTPALAFQSGARPFGEVFVLHGLAVDGGLDALVLGDPPSPRRERRLETLLDAAALALLVPIAAEVCVTSAGVLLAALAGLCAIAAFEVPVFPYFRLAPLLLAVLMLLRFARTRGDKALFAAMAASTLGLLWSLDVGLYAVMTTAIALLFLRAWRPLLTIVAVALPFVVLLLLHADVPRFLHDSFVVIPRSIDAVWSLPMRTDWSWESARYFLPPALCGMLAVFALRAPREERMRVAIITIASLFAFRTAAGRCGWSHTRYGVPLIGIALVAFVAEPLFVARRRVTAVVITAFLIVYVELIPNLTLGAKLLGGWRGRQSHAGLVPYPLRTGKGIYTTPENASDLAAVNGFLNLHAPPGAPLLDVSNERALLYLLERRPATRCNDIAMLSSPTLLTEALRQLDASPPPAVILSGNPAVDDFDGLPNRQRVPALFAWIDAHYPRRQQVGRFVVATK
jgi:hypothetical protein